MQLAYFATCALDQALGVSRVKVKSVRGCDCNIASVAAQSSVDKVIFEELLTIILALLG